jgi:hypothetical protein
MSFEKQSFPHCWLLLMGLLFSFLVNAQQSPDSPVRGSPANLRGSSAILRGSPADFLDNYTRARIGPDSRLFNGREYIRNGISAKGFPFFEWDSLRPGSLTYDGILYHDIAMECDLVSDQLIIHNFTGDALISLVPEKITFFSIAGHRFRYVTPTAVAPTASHPPETGFYEELYATPRLALLARRKKTLIFPSTQDDQPKYVQVDRYFLLIDDNAYSIRNKNDLMAVLKDKKDPLKKFIRKNKLSFKRQHIENSLIQTAIYYQEIKR